MPISGRKNEFENLIVKMVIQMPNYLSEQEINLLRELVTLRK